MPFIGPLKGEENAVYLVPETLKIEECRIPFIGPLKGKRTPHTSFRRRSRPLGQAYAPSEVSGILSLNQGKVSGLF